MSASSAFPFRVASGFRPLTGLHIGHYGAVLRDICELQYARAGCSFVFIADHHSRSRWSVRADFANGHARSIELARQLIAIGVDPDYSAIYRQSDVPEIFEFMWFLAGITPHGSLSRGHTLNAVPNATAGIYLYPLLMIADILSLRATQVVVGNDQKVHIDLARDMAEKLQKKFSSEFVPTPSCHLAEPKLYRGFRGEKHGNTKMDGDTGNDIPLFGDSDVIDDKIRRIFTPAVQRTETLPTEESLIISYAEAIGGASVASIFEADFSSGNYGFKDMKKRLNELFMDTFCSARERYNDISDAEVEEILRIGGQRAREAVADLIADVRSHISINV